MPPDGFPTNTPFNFIFRRYWGIDIKGLVVHPDYYRVRVLFWSRKPKTKEEKDSKEEKEKEEKESMKEKEEYRDTIRGEFYHLKKNTHQEDQNQNNAIDSGLHFITPDERPPVGEKKKNDDSNEI
jgi:citrate synthase